METNNAYTSLLSISIAFFVVFSSLTSTEAYDSRDRHGNITIIWDVISWTPDGYIAIVTMYNFQQYRQIRAPGWNLGWTWARKEVIWSMVGAQTTEQGDCSKFKRDIPHCCKKDLIVVDLLPDTPYNMQVANCCKGGVLNSWAASSFQLSVGSAGNSNKTVHVPMNFTFKAPQQGYTCGLAKIVKPSRFVSQDGRRVAYAFMTWKVICEFSKSLRTRLDGSED